MALNNLNYDLYKHFERAHAMWGLLIYATVALLKRLSINHSSLLWGLWYPSNMTVIAKGFHWDHPRSSSTSSLLMNWPKQHEKQGCREPCCPSYKLLLLLLMYRNQWESGGVPYTKKLSYIMQSPKIHNYFYDHKFDETNPKKYLLCSIGQAKSNCHSIKDSCSEHENIFYYHN